MERLALKSGLTGNVLGTLSKAPRPLWGRWAGRVPWWKAAGVILARGDKDLPRAAADGRRFFGGGGRVGLERIPEA